MEILIENRMADTLDASLKDDANYQSINESADNIIFGLSAIDLSQQQEEAVNYAIEACIASGSAYGRVAYKQGFQDAIKLLQELGALSNT